MSLSKEQRYSLDPIDTFRLFGHLCEKKGIVKFSQSKSVLLWFCYAHKKTFLFICIK